MSRRDTTSEVLMQRSVVQSGNYFHLTLHLSFLAKWDEVFSLEATVSLDIYHSSK